jgi:uncharacterized protein YbjT (DUF2867 family)
MKAAVIGGSGLVGGHLLRELVAAGWDVTAVGRREHPVPPGVRLVVVDAGKGFQVPACDAAFSALGTTIRQAGSQDAFRAVDHGLVVQFASDAKAMGAQQVHVVSSVGADPAARAFYLRVKGEMERDVAALGIAGTCLYRPSMLHGERPEPRRGERFGFLVGKALRPVLPAKYRLVEAYTVARAMARHALAKPSGTHVHHNDEIEALAAAARAPGLAG